jgi:hypothetical protein
MPEEFAILKIDSDMRGNLEQLGSKPKFWFQYQGEKWLFKEARENTGEDWAEKIGSEIAASLGMSTHQAELAVWEGRRGCAVRSFLRPRSVLVHGNELLGGQIIGYDPAKQWRQCDHTIENIVAVIEKLFPDTQPRRVAALRMVGYLLLDALIGNTDRHHENWGVIADITTIGQKLHITWQLAPTFDHASSLGRELTDEARTRILQGGTMDRYIRKGRGGIFLNADSKHGMSPMATIEEVARRYPDLYAPWHRRVMEWQPMTEDLIARIPAERISEPGRQFALAFVRSSCSMLPKAS